MQTEPDPIAAALTAPRARFELAEVDLGGARGRIYRNAPRTLDAIYAAAQPFAQRDLAIHGERRWTYNEVLKRAAALSGTLAARSVGKGTRVAILMANCPEWMVAFIAITWAGATAVLINSRSAPDEIAAALNETDSRLLIVDEQRRRMMRDLGEQRPMMTVEDADSSAARPDIAIDPEDEAIVMFTSGTTARPKGAILTHRGVTTGLMNIEYAMALVGARIAALIGPEAMKAATARPPSSLLTFPLIHTSGCYSVFLSNFCRGGKIVILPKWDAGEAAALIEREKIGAFSGSPTMLWDLLRVDRAAGDLSSLVSVGIGGQALLPNLMSEITGAFPRAILGGGYGSTETNGAVAMIAGADLVARPTSSGRILPTADVAIFRDDGTLARLGEIGEIRVRGAMLMRGYCSQPEATATAFEDGWLKMGDLGYFDAEGYLHVVDRKKDIVISGGENISCTEVERVAVEHESVEEAAAFGVPDERLGERLILAVVPRNGKPVDDSRLKEHFASRLAIYKVPREIVWSAELPRTGLGKLDRKELQRRMGIAT